jgi:uncharacterized protein YkwD
MVTRRLREILTVLVFVYLASGAALADDFDPKIERSLFDLLNQEREKAVLSPLKWNDKLMQSARKHAERMKAIHMLTHQAAGEPALTQRVAATGLRFNASAENVAFASNPEDIHPGWMQSAGHRANILSPKYNAVGIGVLRAGDVYYAVQNFAHVTSADTVAQAEDRLAAALNKQRASKGLLPVKVMPTASMNQAVCGMAQRDVLDSRMLPTDRGSRATIAFTASEPEEMPQSFVDVIAFPGLKMLYLGSCYMATAHYPGGTYWFGVVY